MAVKVSVIVTDYNLGQYLTTALESVRLQTFEDWECIVVDDGSTDDSADIVNGFIATGLNQIILRKLSGLLRAIRRLR